GREDSPWYPTMRLFRQPSLGDWNSVLDRLMDAIREKITDHTASTDATQIASSPFDQSSLTTDHPTTPPPHHLTTPQPVHSPVTTHHSPLYQARVCDDQGLAFYDAGRYEEAVAWFQAALEWQPDFATAYYHMGLARSRQGTLDQAEQNF